MWEKRSRYVPFEVYERKVARARTKKGRARRLDGEKKRKIEREFEGSDLP